MHFFKVITASMLWIVMQSVAIADFKPFQPLPAHPPVPSDNLMSPMKIKLGKQLFFDARLSKNKSMNCNSCHNVMAGGSSPQAKPTGAGGQAGQRNAPTLWNVGFTTIYFLDGRATSLEAAIKEHLLADEAMAMEKESRVVDGVQQIPGYVKQFVALYGDEDPVNYDNISKSLAAYLRSLVTNDSAFDQYLRGNQNAISTAAKKGMEQFIEVGCASCHFWVNMAGPIPGLAFQMGEGFYELFPNHLGSEYDARYQLTDDVGRIKVTGEQYDRHMWRVASLRNIALTAPYFHNGAVGTLDEAVRVMAMAQYKKRLPEKTVEEITAFLNTLTGNFPIQTMPRLPATQ
ncbi:Cytochrome c551 peroxidase [hydrothermal vent metagenome]|uniref:Cytochrome c551 peroxidase n=1 Tax=hydrothermal vent metagenome TaxID=652676 RepID=A0A3B0ZGS2_9ZZZZ